MKIELRISPAHLYLVTPSDKSFLLWKWNLWCIKMIFVMKMTVYTIWLVWLKGCASAIFILWLWVSSGRRESETLGSLWITHSRNQTSPKPIIYVDIWIYDCWPTVNLITIHTALSSQPGIHRASAHYRRLTNITLSKRYCSH